MMQAIEPKRLKDMKPHEELIAGVGITMIRVVGGWIYWKTIYTETKLEDEGILRTPIALTGVFVPENVSSPASIS